jgi:hypothetical protein
MDKIKRIILCMLLLALSLCLFSCKSEVDPLENDEKYIIYTTHTDAVFTQKQLLKMADIIVKGTVTEKNGSVFSNPDGSLKDIRGYQIVNQLITDYTVEIEEIYKGSYEGDAIHVKTGYGDGLDSDLILHGEDDDSVLGTELEQVQLAVGGDCILLLTYSDTGYEESSGYFPTVSLGYLAPDGNGNYTNGDNISNVTVTPATLPAEIIAACAE